MRLRDLEDKIRGGDLQQGAMFSYIFPPQMVPQRHPLRAVCEIHDPVLEELSLELSRLY